MIVRLMKKKCVERECGVTMKTMSRLMIIIVVHVALALPAVAAKSYVDAEEFISDLDKPSMYNFYRSICARLQICV